MSTTNPKAADPVAEIELTEGVLAPDGTRRPHPLLDRYLGDVHADVLRGLWQDMLLVRRIDSEGVALQRQGQLGLWAPCRGQEAAQIGTVRALRDDDFVFPSYRELGVLFARGLKGAEYTGSWRGEVGSAYDPAALHVAPMQIIIGAQSLHAVGYALGSKIEASEQLAVTYFGDGATSGGDVNEAMVFAASFQVPVVFVCQNNHWAISEPVTVQSRAPIAGRAPGFGIPSLRVDGNDVLACFAAMRWAAEHARSGGGPVFLELVTYRMGPHTTSDDPTRYRDEAEVESWGRRDPIARVEAHLRAAGELSEEHIAAAQAAADAVAAEMRASCLAQVTREPLAVFDNVYAEPHTGLARQRAEFAAFGDSLEGGLS